MKVLIVDDEPIIRSGMMKMAQQYTQPFQTIETANNGLEAIDRFSHFEPDLLITDIRMPKMDGLELCRILHNSHPNLLKVVISGYNDFEYAQKCLSYGVKHYLLKPVTPPDLHDIFDQILKLHAQSCISISGYVEWIERIKGSIWSLQMDEMTRLMTEWRERCSLLTINQLKYQLDDVLHLLDNYFQEKKQFSMPGLQDPLKASTREDLYILFECRMRALMKELQCSRQGNYKDPMEEAKLYIDTRLSVEITLAEVADLIGVSPSYFSTLFRRMTGETFVSYRMNKRMEKAKDMLAIPHMRTFDIAIEVGYEDYPHFTKTFKKIYGVSPSEYRNSIGIK
ncbi:response regulator [Paenibacillus sp. 2RAB27]|uniref:response regulator transcription factor n=1 Tax=Paenibacillus sp. 2RAB27 TaxID=3232991 RepID=UPI003F973220